MLRLISSFVVILSLSCHLHAEVIVDLNKTDTWLAIFDSGLHPRRAFRNGGEGFFEIRPAKAIGFHIRDKRIPAIAAIWSFDIAKNDQVNVIRGVVEEAWTKSEAFEKTRELEAALGGDVAALKQWIDSYPSPSPTGDLWGRRWRSADGTRSVKYYFRHTMQDALPLTITVSIELRWPGGPLGFRTTRMNPPAGYENVDMSFDETYGGTATIPPLNDAKSRIPSPAKGLSLQGQNDRDENEKVSTFLTPWSVMTLLIVVTIGLSWLLSKKRRG